MRLTINTNLSAAKNASNYYDKAKRLRQKLEGTKKMIAETEAKLRLEEKQPEKKPDLKTIERKPEWFEQFRWFLTSSGLLVIGGLDSHTNDLLLRNYSEPHEPVF